MLSANSRSNLHRRHHLLERETLRFSKLRASAVCVFILALAALLTSRARADAGVVLNESLDTSVARITGSGHTAVYLSRICPDGSPVKMRMCLPGEQGSIVSNYTTLGEDQPYEWNIVPLSVYLYGVEDPDDRPLVSSKAIKAALEERYRDRYLAAICTEQRCRSGKSAEWREMVGATLERSMYMFVVKTTVEQDRELIAEFNSLPNVNHFNGMTRNCADFTRRVMNVYYPGADKPEGCGALADSLRGKTSRQRYPRAAFCASSRNDQAQQRMPQRHRAAVPFEEARNSARVFRMAGSSGRRRVLRDHRPLQSRASVRSASIIRRCWKRQRREPGHRQRIRRERSGACRGRYSGARSDRGHEGLLERISEAVRRDG